MYLTNHPKDNFTQEQFPGGCCQEAVIFRVIFWWGNLGYFFQGAINQGAIFLGGNCLEGQLSLRAVILGSRNSLGVGGNCLWGNFPWDNSLDTMIKIVH